MTVSYSQIIAINIVIEVNRRQAIIACFFDGLHNWRYSAVILLNIVFSRK